MNARSLVIGASLLTALVAAPLAAADEGSFIGQVEDCALGADVDQPACYLEDDGSPETEDHQCGIEDRTMAVADDEPGSVEHFVDCLNPLDD